MNHLLLSIIIDNLFMFKVTLLMSELYSCMKVSLNSTQDEVINGRRVVGREGGCAGPLEVTRIEGYGWGHSLQIKQCFSLCYKFEVRRCLVLGPSLYCLVIDNFLIITLGYHIH